MSSILNAASLTVNSTFNPLHINSRVEVAATIIGDLGQISFFAQRSGTNLIVSVVSTEGKLLGRAETVIGLSQIPIFIEIPNGLAEIKLIWSITNK